MTERRGWFMRVGFFLLCFFGVLCAGAQVTTSDIVGSVTDASGGILSGASVSIVNVGTHESRSVQTGSSGTFSFSSLQPGTYSVTIESPGFKKFQIAAIRLVAGDRARADAQLQIGGAEEVVEVTGASPALQTDNSTMSSVIADRAVEDIPLNGRNFITLVQNSPGVTQGNPNAVASGNRPDDRRQTNAVSANGQPEMWNGNLIDGMDNNDLAQGLIMIRPSIDAIQEVKIDTNSYRAEVGRTAGAVINVITKSGTNDFHGSLYEFFRNDKMQANDYFTKRTLPRPAYHQNQFGGSIGGPIIKNKTFFFADAEAYRIIQAAPTGLLTVPTLYQEQHPGDLSDIGGPVIPTALLDPVALKYFALFPAPNVAGATTTNNYTGTPKRTQNSLTMDARVDHHFSSNDSLFVRYSYNPVDTFVPAPLPAVNGVEAGGGTNFPGSSHETAQGFQVNYLHIFSPHLLMELKTGFSRLNIQSLSISYGTNQADKFGMPNVNNFDKYNSGLPPVNIAGFSALGDNALVPLLDRNNVFQYQGSVSYTRGRHDLKAGTGFVRRQLNYYQAIAGEGIFTWTGTPAAALAAFLQGNVSNIQRANPLYSYYIRTTEPYAYVQDDWRLSNTLTINLGVRWDYFSPITNPHNLRANFDLDAAKIVVASDQDRSAGVRPYRKNFAPRIGFAQSFGGKTVLRGAFGMSYYNPDSGGAAPLLPNPPFAYSFTCFPGSTTPSLQCPTGIGKLSQGPPIPSATSTDVPSGGLAAIPFHNPSSYTEQFNLSLQRQFGSNTVTISYIGELGRKQELVVNANLPSPSGSATTPAYFYAAVLPNVNSILARIPGGDSSYHAFQAVLDRRFEKGLSFNAGYTYASNLNDYPDPNGTISTAQQVRGNYLYDYGNSDIAVRHRLVASAAWELPFASKTTGLLRLIAHGWQLNGLGYYQTGLPFTVMDGATTTANSSGTALARINLPGVTTDRPNMVPGRSLSPASRSTTQWFNIAAFTQQPIGTAGNERRNQLWGPKTRQIDLSIFKNFDLPWKAKLQLRAEGFNITNTANFAQPNSNIVSYNSDPVPTPTQAGSFGQITSTRLGSIPRQIQFAGRISF